jgi:multidrug resistance efflux pump
MTVQETGIEVPVKFSAKMKGQADVNIMPQVSGQLMKIFVTEGQHVSRGQKLFVIDSRNAQHELESAKANLQATRAAFYPSISLQGLAGWTNSAGSAVVNPGKILLNAVASLTQPIYAQGKLKANLKINQLEQENFMNKYVQTVIDAGSQVNEALADCQAAVEKHDYYRRQVEVLKNAYRGTHVTARPATSRCSQPKNRS